MAAFSDHPTAAILYLWHGAEMAVTMICIGMPVCRPALTSMLEVLGVLSTELVDRTTGPGGSSKKHHRRSGGENGYPKVATTSYIRNFGQNATWEEAMGRGVGGDDEEDTWSQRRILGMGHVSSHCVTTTRSSTGGIGGDGVNDYSSGSDLDKQGLVKDEDGVFGGEIGFPMRSMSKSGITVTKTVDVTKH